MDFGFDDSQAFKIFLMKFDETREEIHALNPMNGCVSGSKWDDAPLNDKNIKLQTDEECDRRIRVHQSFLKSAIVKTMVVFESFVNDLISEAFDFTQWNDDRAACEYRWPVCKQLVMKLISSYSNKDDKKEEFYEITRDYDVWTYLLEKHRDDTLSNLSPTIVGMKTALKRLFVLDLYAESRLPEHAVPTEGSDKNRKLRQPERESSPAPGAAEKEKRQDTPKKSKAGKNGGVGDKQTESKQSQTKCMKLLEFPLEIMVKNSTFDVLWQIPNGIEKPFNRLVTMKNLEAVTHVLNLVYAIRCIAVHGKFQTTLAGCLKGFPQSSNGLNLGDPIVEDYLYDIYLQISHNALRVDYHMCINVTRFIKSTAYSLQKALGYFAYYQLKYNEDQPAIRKFWGLKMYLNGMDVPWGKEKRKENEDAVTVGSASHLEETAMETRIIEMIIPDQNSNT